MHPVSCHHCGSCVLVEKNSLAHTLVQWTADTRQCAELGERPGQAVVRTCLRLRDSIEAAVRGGRVPIGTGQVRQPIR